MPDLLERFRSRVMDPGLIQRGEHVLAAVSGGVDSVVLLHLLLGVRDAYNLTVSVAHLNHGLRGEDADADQAFVEDLCRQHSVPCVSEKRDVLRYAQIHRLSEETAARVVRYDFLRRAKAQLRADVIATAHHADDQVETVIDHFLRGSGLLGLSGMAARRGDIVRPLLWASRADIEEFARQRNLSYRTDRTNLDLEYRRNRIRLELIPYLRRYFNPNLREVVLRTAGILSEAEAFIERQAVQTLRRVKVKKTRDEIVLDLDRLLREPTLIQKYVVLACFETLGGQRWLLNHDRIERSVEILREGTSGSKLYLGGGICLTKSQDSVAVHRVRQVEFSYPLRIGGEATIPELDLVLNTEVVDRSTYAGEVGCDPCVEFIDLDRVQGELWVRNARPGDRFQPLGSPGTKKLSDFFIDQKVPSYERWRTPVVTDGETIVWVCGFRLDDRYKVTERTKRILKLSLGEVIGGEE